MTLLAIVSCRPPVGAPVSSPATSDEPVESSTPIAVPTAAPSATKVAEQRPSWVADLEGQLDCDGPMSQMGQEVPAEVGPFDPAPTPERALEGLLSVGMYAWLPASGFEAPHVEGHWAVYRYTVGGAVKAIVVSTNQFLDVPEEVGWEIVGLRACDPSEFDPADGLSDAALWLDAEGDRVATTRIFSRLGPEHCGWERVTFLEFEDKQYLRDAEGVLADSTTSPFRKVDALPTDAVDTGLHTANLRLFTVPDDRVVYVRSRDGSIERWGRATEPIGCM